MKVRLLRNAYDYEKGKVYELKEPIAIALLTQGYAIRETAKFAKKYEMSSSKFEKGKIKGSKNAVE